MSKLINAMRLRETGNCVAYLGDVEVSVKERTAEYAKPNPSYYLEYHLGVEIGVTFVGSSTEIAHRQSNVEQMIREEVFGEYRSLLYRIQNAAYNRDFDEVSKLTSQIERSMFHE